MVIGNAGISRRSEDRSRRSMVACVTPRVPGYDSHAKDTDVTDVGIEKLDVPAIHPSHVRHV